jgi:hypothetical protein
LHLLIVLARTRGWFFLFFSSFRFRWLVELRR